MANQIKHETYPASATALSTGLNSQADGARVLSAAISNTNGDTLIDLELLVAAQGGARAADAAVEVYLLASIDGGTNFTYGDASTAPPRTAHFCTFDLDASTSARYSVLTNLPAPPDDFKLLLANETGQALAASGNTLKYVLHSMEVVT